MYESIKALKDLLDSGAITQEEYEAKKREVLGILTEEDRLKLDAAEAARQEEERKHKEEAREKRLNAGKRIAPIAVAALAALAILVFAMGAEVRNSRNNMEPYLQALGASVPRSMKLDLSNELVQGSGSVEVMGVEGTISYEADDGEVVIAVWKSNDTFTGDERDDFIESLNDYFGNDYRFEFDQIGDREWYYYDHVWQDKTVPCEAHVAYNYIPSRDNLDADDKRVTIEWDASGGSAYSTDSVDIM